MSNLIITIISIALVAVGAIMAVWYGGIAFQEAQAKGKANQIISHLQQIRGAMNVWASMNGGYLPDPRSNRPVVGSAGTWSATSLASFLEPTYLASNTIFGLRGTLIVNRSSDWADEHGVIMILGSSGNPGSNNITAEVCRQIEGIRTGTVPATARNWADTAAMNQKFCGQFGCFGDPAGSWAGPPYAGQYIPYIRISGAPKPAEAECN